MFHGVKYIKIKELGLSQIYLNQKKIDNIYKWINLTDLSTFHPLPVYDFGNGKLTLTDGHTRAFVAHKLGLEEVPVQYDTDDMITSEIGQLLYKVDIAWCERFDLRSVMDLESRIIPDEQYQVLWLDRCEKAYSLYAQTTEVERNRMQLLRPNLFLYGASKDLQTIYFEDQQGLSCVEVNIDENIRGHASK